MADAPATNPSGVAQPAAPTAPLTGVAAFRQYIQDSDNIITSDAQEDANQEETSEYVAQDNAVLDDTIEESQPEGDDTLEDTQVEPTLDLNAKVTVVIDGVEQQITLDEARQGYQRQVDYTHKTQEVARIRTELQGTIENYKQGLELIGRYFTADVEAFKTVDWDKIKAEDPAKWSSLKIEQQEAQQRAASLQAAFNEAAGLQQQQQNQVLREQLPVEFNKLVDKFPDYKDPVKRADISKGWADYGQTQGFTAAELNSIIDHRMLVVLDKAKKYDELKNKTNKVIDKKVTQNPQVIRKLTTTTQMDKKERESKQAMDNLRATGSRTAAIEVFKQHLNRG